MDKIKFIAVIEKDAEECTGRIIAASQQEQSRVGTSPNWIGISHPISSFRTKGNLHDVDKRLTLKIKSMKNHETSDF